MATKNATRRMTEAEHAEAYARFRMVSVEVNEDDCFTIQASDGRYISGDIEANGQWRTYVGSENSGVDAPEINPDDPTVLRIIEKAKKYAE